VISGQEQCDNGNWWAYDGYIWSCTVECGWEHISGMCTGICGDGMSKGAERYDDGNTHLDTCGWSWNAGARRQLRAGGEADSGRVLFSRVRGPDAGRGGGVQVSGSAEQWFMVFEVLSFDESSS